MANTRTLQIALLGLAIIFMVVAAQTRAADYGPGLHSIGAPADYGSDHPAISFPLQTKKFGNSKIKSYQSGSPDLYQRMYDPRLNQRLEGQIARHYSGWQFTAVYTADSNGNYNSTVDMAVYLVTLWNPIDVGNGVWWSNNGRVIEFRSGGQILYSFNDRSNTTGGSGVCGTGDTLREKEFTIDNHVFIGMDNIKVRALKEAFSPC